MRLHRGRLISRRETRPTAVIYASTGLGIHVWVFALFMLSIGLISFRGTPSSCRDTLSTIFLRGLTAAFLIRKARRPGANSVSLALLRSFCSLSCDITEIGLIVARRTLRLFEVDLLLRRSVCLTSWPSNFFCTIHGCS